MPIAVPLPRKVTGEAKLVRYDATPDSGMIGQTISHYRVLRVLGEGGMGIVYEAEDVRLGRHVALKFVVHKALDRRVGVERFQREARTASALNHPNICTIHVVGEGAGRHLE